SVIGLLGSRSPEPASTPATVLTSDLLTDMSRCSVDGVMAPKYSSVRTVPLWSSIHPSVSVASMTLRTLRAPECSVAGISTSPRSCSSTGSSATGPVPREIGVVGSTRATFWNDHRMLSGACQLSLSMPAAPSAVPAGPAASAGGVGTVCPGDGSVTLHLVFSDRSSSGFGGAGSAGRLRRRRFDRCLIASSASGRGAGSGRDESITEAAPPPGSVSLGSRPAQSRRRVLRRHRDPGVHGPDRIDEVLGPDAQRIRSAHIGLQRILRHQHTEVRTLPAIVPGPEDAQEERLIAVLQRVPVQCRPLVCQRPVLVEAVLAGQRRMSDVLGDRSRLLDDHLAPLGGPGQLLPSLVDLIDVEVELDIDVFEQMEQEKKNIGLGTGGDVRDRRGSGDARIELTEPTVVAVEVDEHIDFEEAPVAAFAQTFAHLAHELAGLGSLLRVEDIAFHLIAAPAARIRGEFGETGQFGEIGADDDSAGGDDGFDGDRGVADPFHHLQ